MKHYEPGNPRVAFGVAAAIMTAITIGVAVMPATMDSNVAETRILAAVAPPPSTGVVSTAAAATTPSLTDQVAGAARTEVVALHDAGPSTARCAWKVKTRAHRHTLAAS